MATKTTTAIHVRACNIATSEAERSRAANYVDGLRTKYGRTVYRSDLQHLNRSTVFRGYLGKSLEQIREEMAQVYKAKVGKTPPTNPYVIKTKNGKTVTREGWSPIREAIVVISPTTTIDQLGDLVNAMERKWGIHGISIDIHRDEGSWNDNGDWVTNQHAHLVLDFFDWASGRTIKLTEADMSAMQDMCAECLHMDRGEKGSTARHKGIVEYRNQEERKKLKRLKEQVEKKQAELNKLDKDAGKKKEELADLDEQVNKKTTDANNLNEAIKLADKRVKGLTTMVSNLETREAELAAKINALKAQAATDGKLSAAVAKRLRDLEEEEGKTAAALADKNKKLEEAKKTLDETLKKLDAAKLDAQNAKSELDNIEKMAPGAAFRVACAAFLERALPLFDDAYYNLSSRWQEVFYGSVWEGGAEGVEDLVNIYACLIELAAGGTYSLSGGGGSDSDLRWDGRNPDEDDKHYLDRCFSAAENHVCQRRKLSSYSKRRR